MDNTFEIFFITFFQLGALAIVVERSTTVLKKILENPRWPLLSGVISIILCMVFDFRVIERIAGINSLVSLPKFGELLDALITGIVVSGGASGIYDLFKRMIVHADELHQLKKESSNGKTA